jgi:uncharacterized membrane protein
MKHQYSKLMKTTIACVALLFGAATTAVPVGAQQAFSNATGIVWSTPDQRLLRHPQTLQTHPSNQSHDVRYRVIPMPLLPGTTNSFLNFRAVNNLEHVAGYSYAQSDVIDTARAFIWQHESIAALPLLSGWTSSVGFSINDRNQVVGGALRTDSDGRVRQTAVLWDRGQAVNLGTLQPNSQSVAFDVNIFGVVVGQNFSLDTFLRLPTVWSAGAAHQLPLLAGETEGAALEINALGVIVGWQSVQDVNQIPCVWYWNGAGYTAVNLGSFGGNYGQGFGINDLAQAVGFSNYAGDEHSPAFTWDFLHGIHILSPLPGDTDATAFGINNSGQAVGMSAQALPDSFTVTSVIWKNGAPKNLQTLVPAGTPPLDFSVDNINESGDIALNGSDSDGNPVGLLLVPTR